MLAAKGPLRVKLSENVHVLWHHFQALIFFRAKKIAPCKYIPLVKVVPLFSHLFAFLSYIFIYTVHNCVSLTRAMVVTTQKLGYLKATKTLNNKALLLSILNFTSCCEKSLDPVRFPEKHFERVVLTFKQEPL